LEPIYNINRWLAAEANYGYDRNKGCYHAKALDIPVAHLLTIAIRK
jgi:hypothetical protein